MLQRVLEEHQFEFAYFVLLVELILKSQGFRANWIQIWCILVALRSFVHTDTIVIEHRIEEEVYEVAWPSHLSSDVFSIHLLDNRKNPAQIFLIRIC